MPRALVVRDARAFRRTSSLFADIETPSRENRERVRMFGRSIYNTTRKEEILSYQVLQNVARENVTHIDKTTKRCSRHFPAGPAVHHG